MGHRTDHDADILSWSREQAQLPRDGRFDQLDLTHLADEIEDVGKSEQREHANRMALLLAHLLKRRYRPERRGPSWEITIRHQRKGILRRLAKPPSLKRALSEEEWWDGIWEDATALSLELAASTRRGTA